MELGFSLLDLMDLGEREDVKVEQHSTHVWMKAVKEQSRSQGMVQHKSRGLTACSME
jgi:hypothetical protein